MIKFVDMFSGIGGFREGLTRAGGFACVGHCEIDKYANRSYNALFDTKGEWFIEDELHLQELGERKIALFCCIPDSDKSLNYLVGMIYTQLIQTLYRQADRVHKGRLPVPVHCLMDEYANISLPKDTFLSALATMRSRAIFCSIIVQNMAQFKAMYKDDWESLVGLCDEFLYLGGIEKETHKYVSELLGKETISTTSYNQSKGRSGSYSINHQQSGRDMPYLFVKSSVALNLS